MTIELLSGQLAMIVAALLVAGSVTGLLSGLLGIGGGGVLVPVLFEVFRLIGTPADVRLHLAIGTALAVIIPTSFRSFMAHRARGAVDREIVASMAVFVVAGVGVGTLIARLSDDTALKLIWVVAGTLMGLRLILSRPWWRLGDDIPGQPFRAIYGLFIGTISTLMSIGGGVFVTTMMTLYGRGIRQAVGTSSAFAPLIAVPGALGFVWAGWGAEGLPPGSVGYVSALGAACVMPASIVAAPLGARLAHGIRPRTLELAFGIFIFVVVARFLYVLIWPA